MSTSFNKQVFDVEIQSPAHLFHDVMTYKAHSLNKMAPEAIQKSTMESSDEGTVLLSMDYTQDGKKKSAKGMIEKIDDKNISTTWKITDGDLLREYKSFKIEMHAIPRGSSGSLVQWSFEYENNKEGSPDLHSLMEFCVTSCKTIDNYLTNAQLNTA